MAHIGRTVKNVEAPRPLKSRSSLKNANYMLIEELIQLIENVALTLQSGINNMEPMATLVQNLRIHGPQLETVSKDTLDRAFVVFRNASQDERLNIMTRLNLLELIELRAKGWEDNGFNSYYKTKQVTNTELPDGPHHGDHTQSAFLSTSPTFGGSTGAAAAAAIAAVGSAQQQQFLLGPGEVIRNSGKFPKPTKIPGKTYCKDEVVIRNADSGKVMGIKGRRVHMIEELSETIISFQRVNPGAKERLVQITGPSEEKINYAKQLIEDTIRRNASPVRLDPSIGGAHTGGGSCSSLASSNSDEATPRTPSAAGGNIANRLSFNSAQNFMTASAAAQQVATQQQVMNIMGAIGTSIPSGGTAAVASSAGKMMRPNQQVLLHSYSTNDASLGEYKYTVNVGQHLIKITGDCCDLVRVAKLVLDDYFSSAEFLASIEAGAAFDGSIISPISTPSTPMGPPQFMMGTALNAAPPLADSGIGLNYMALQASNNSHEVDDEVFTDANATSGSQNSNGLARSRRSHFSRKDSTPDVAGNAVSSRNKNDNVTTSGNNDPTDSTRIVHQYEHLLYYAKSPHSWALPYEWQKICEKFPSIVRNKVTHQTSPMGQILHVSSTTTATTTAILNNISVNTANITSSISSALSRHTPTPTSFPLNSNVRIFDNSLQLNIKRKGFFNRQTFSIDEERYDVFKQQQQQQQQNFSVVTVSNTDNLITNIDNNSKLKNVENLTSIRTGLTSASFSSANHTQVPSSDGHSRHKLLSKQIKIISAIINEPQEQGKIAEIGDKYANSGQKDNNYGDDDDVEIMADHCHTNSNRHKLLREYRSNSTYD